MILVSGPASPTGLVVNTAARATLLPAEPHEQTGVTGMANSETNPTVRVAVAGATGWVGRAIAEGVLEAPDLTLVGAIARSAAGRDLGQAWGGEPVGVAVAGQ